MVRSVSANPWRAMQVLPRPTGYSARRTSSSRRPRRVSWPPFLHPWYGGYRMSRGALLAGLGTLLLGFTLPAARADEVERVSVDSAGVQANGASYSATLSAD